MRPATKRFSPDALPARSRIIDRIGGYPGESVRYERIAAMSGTRELSATRDIRASRQQVWDVLANGWTSVPNG
ncbi:Uncharacterised protein [Mycobacterium xenopi]|uniref:Uncharacterized protein n=1 Tax=Mycobacterium xenopi TaxID=1789 RepID=A0AAD1M0Y9_MYCXE|nr:hypothetical protein MYXE_21320 [Mycobacterium xenopi]SPX78219.1 Uncharacterised protein [Mycobacterium xenopi]